MKIKNFEKETDLHRFLKFCNKLKDENVIVEKEDWDNMCGIVVKHNLGRWQTGFCINFYDDGSFRAIIDLEEDDG